MPLRVKTAQMEPMEFPVAAAVVAVLKSAPFAMMEPEMPALAAVPPAVAAWAGVRVTVVEAPLPLP